VGSLIDIDRQEPQLSNKALKFGMGNWVIPDRSMFEEVAEQEWIFADTLYRLCRVLGMRTLIWALHTLMSKS